MVDGSAINISVFTADFSSATKSLIINTVDGLVAGIYDFKVDIVYTNLPLISLGSETFRVILIDCATDTLLLDE